LAVRLFGKSHRTFAFCDFGRPVGKPAQQTSGPDLGPHLSLAPALGGLSVFGWSARALPWASAPVRASRPYPRTPPALTRARGLPCAPVAYGLCLPPVRPCLLLFHALCFTTPHDGGHPAARWPRRGLSAPLRDRRRMCQLLPHVHPISVRSRGLPCAPARVCPQCLPQLSFAIPTATQIDKNYPRKLTKITLAN
jgi:hypothetical protein